MRSLAAIAFAASLIPGIGGISLGDDVPLSSLTLSPGDKIQIVVDGVQELGKEVTIPEEGGLSYWPIGVIQASGRTAEKVAAEIRAKLADGYVKDPRVTVIVVSTPGKNVMVIGAVERPGPVPAKSGITVLELLSHVGGLRKSTSTGGFRDGSSNEAIVVRKRQDGAPAVQSERISLKGLLAGNLEQNVMLYGGDVVIFPSITETDVKVNVLGAVGRPGQFPLTEGMTFVDLIALAGGPTGKAGDQALVIPSPKGRRQEGKSPKSFALDSILSGENVPDIKLNAGDTIVVLASTEVDDNFFIIGEVKKPGMYAWREGMTVLNCISVAGGLTDRATTKDIQIVKDGGAGTRPTLKTSTSHRVERGDTVVVPEGWF